MDLRIIYLVRLQNIPKNISYSLALTYVYVSEIKNC